MLRSALIAGSVTLFAAGATAQQLSLEEQLGKALFFDTNLSVPPGVSCAACHGPGVGFTGPVSELNAHGGVYPGSVPTRFGNRKPPASAYAGDSPVLYYDPVEEAWIGGMFWDGRASGAVLGDPLTEQALGPFLNDLEMNVPSRKEVVRRVALSTYAPLFEAVWGPGSLDWRRDVDLAYERIGRSIAAYERSAEVNPFSSKYDAFLRGLATLEPEEQLGLQLFRDPAKGNCAACHPADPGPQGEPPLFTDFTYDNLGIPANPANPFYSMPPAINPDGDAYVDPGLGGFLQASGAPMSVWRSELGKHKVPTLRNVDLRPDPAFVKAFAHNGFFTSLESIVHFYNTRDVEPWPAPEVAENVNREELGNLGLTAAEEAAIVAFLRTLSDGYVPTDGAPPSK
ncbi:MAG: cytochrome C [Planctomycetes bacterium]|nr:cytochrome C [Planctomycetota bacterium]